MRIDGYRCDNCLKEALGLLPDRYRGTYDDLPGTWFLVTQTPTLESSRTPLTFCCISCLYQWSSNQLASEAKEVSA
jgi:hypothetical protein